MPNPFKKENVNPPAGGLTYGICSLQLINLIQTYCWQPVLIDHARTTCWYPKEITSYKLKIITALNFAPVYIISKARKLRHNLEHSYKKPQKDKVKEAIDIAELFISAINSKLFSVTSEFYISEKKLSGSF